MGAQKADLDTNQKPCPACAESILKEAKKCKHCNEVIDSNYISKNENKSVGIFLGAMILIFPYIFSWFTLRKGHSSVSRIVSFGWMAVVLVAYFSSSQQSSELKQSKRNNASNQAASKNNLKPVAKPTPADPMGAWSIGQYVDEFGSKTGNGYIATKQSIMGSFSNSATTNSRLKVDFILGNYKRASIMLYEYAGKNPVKAYSNSNYLVLVKSSDGKKYNLKATNYKSDRLTLDTASSQKLHSILKKGGNIQFLVQEPRSPVNQYRFEIGNANGYYNAYKKLHNIK